jgi:hypothetical protein
MSRYNDAIAANQSLESYLEDLAYNNMSDEEKTAVTKSQFDDAISQAMTGDAGSVGEATRLASQLLSLTQGTDQYATAFKDVNTTLSKVQSLFADVEAPSNTEVADIEAQIKAEEDSATADILAEKIGELAEASDQNLNQVIESLSINLEDLGDALNVNLLELIDVTKGEGEQAAATDVLTDSTNVVEISSQNLTPEITAATTTTSSASAGIETSSSIIEELRLLREEVAALRADANDNADTASTQRDQQIATSESQLEETIRSNLRQVAVS